MIKKLNKEIDNLPIIVKIIACIIMTILITLMSFLFVSVVNAATTTIGLNTINSVDGSGTSTNWGNSSSSHTLQSNAQRFEFVYGNVNAGYYEGHITLELTYTGRYDINKTDIGIECRGSSSALTCANNISWEKSVSSFISTYKISIWFNGNLTQQEWFQVRVKFPSGNYVPTGTAFKGTGSIDWTESDAATNTTINNAVTQIIQNAVENTTTVSQQIIQSNTDLSNAIANIMNNATTSIQNSILMSYKHCESVNKLNIVLDKKWLSYTGDIHDSPNFGVTDYFKIDNAELKIVKGININDTTVSFCFYNIDKNLISCTKYLGLSDNTVVTKPNNAYYFRASIQRNSNIPTFAICKDSTDAIIENQNQNTDRMIDHMILFHEAEEEDWEEEKGLLQSILSAIGGIFSSSIDDPSNTLNSFNNSIATDNTISSLLLLPVRLYQNVLNNINGSCNSFNLGSLYNHQLTMTCIQPQSFLGSALYGVIDVIISGFFILHIRKKFVDIFNHLTSLRTGGNELE